MKKFLICVLVLVTGLVFVSCGGKDAKIASLDNKLDKKISMEYPDGIQVSDNAFQGSINSYCVSKEYAGEDYSFGLKFGKVSSISKNVDNFLKYYQSGNIVEDKKIAGKKSRIYQGYMGPLQVIIPYDNKHYACVEFKVKGLENENDASKIRKAYQELYENKEIVKMIDSIKLEKFEKSDKPYKNDYYSIAPVGKWFIEKTDKDSNRVVMGNNELLDYTVRVRVSVKDLTIDRFESIYASDAEKSETKIGDIDYKMYKDTRFSSTYLVKEVKDNLVVVEVDSITVEQAADILKTIKIK